MMFRNFDLLIACSLGFAMCHAFCFCRTSVRGTLLSVLSRNLRSTGPSPDKAWCVGYRNVSLGPCQAILDQLSCHLWSCVSSSLLTSQRAPPIAYSLPTNHYSMYMFSNVIMLAVAPLVSYRLFYISSLLVHYLFPDLA